MRYLKHIGVWIFLVFHDNCLIPRQCVRYRMLVRIQYCLRVLRWLNHIVFGSFHTVWFWSFVQDEFWTASTSVSLWQETIVSKRIWEFRFFGDEKNEREKNLVSSCEWPAIGRKHQSKMVRCLLLFAKLKFDSSHSVGCNQFGGVEKCVSRKFVYRKCFALRIFIRYPCDQSINH